MNIGLIRRALVASADAMSPANNEEEAEAIALCNEALAELVRDPLAYDSDYGFINN